MKRTVLSLALIALSVPVSAQVVECRAIPADKDTDLLESTIRIYTFEEETHSIFVEAPTNWGDTLPYLFDCSDTCDMLLVYDEEFEYSIDVTYGTVWPRLAVMETVSTIDDFEIIDTFILKDCR